MSDSPLISGIVMPNISSVIENVFAGLLMQRYAGFILITMFFLCKYGMVFMNIPVNFYCMYDYYKVSLLHWNLVNEMEVNLILVSMVPV